MHSLQQTMPLSPSTSITISNMTDEINNTIPLKPLGLMLPVKSSFPDHSLLSVMSPQHLTLKTLQLKFSRELKQCREIHLSAPLNVEPDLCTNEPPSKRRRFQRRNSKTAAMLMCSMSSIIACDFDHTSEQEDASNSQGSVQNTEDPWEGGLEIAEELVRQLKLRRTAGSCTQRKEPAFTRGNQQDFC